MNTRNNVNAKDELLYFIHKRVGMNKIIKWNKTIKCAIIEYTGDPDEGEEEVFRLPVGYTDSQLSTFLEQLNFEYDCGYGLQHLYGTVWFEDDSWLRRGEYDGSEWWEYLAYPDIPKELL